jgi:hypothetical protein
MTKIVTLRNEPVSIAKEPVPDVVELLRSLLQEAESGELRSVAVIVERATETQHFVRPKANNHLIAGLAICQHAILASENSN